MKTTVYGIEDAMVSRRFKEQSQENEDLREQVRGLIQQNADLRERNEELGSELLIRFWSVYRELVRIFGNLTNIGYCVSSWDEQPSSTSLQFIVGKDIEISINPYLCTVITSPISVCNGIRGFIVDFDRDGVLANSDKYKLKVFRDAVSTNQDGAPRTVTIE